LGIPYRGTTSESTYFITANVLMKMSLFQANKIARLFIDLMLLYRTQRKYLLHEFVVMPDHLHLILTPTGITLERAMQLIKGRFSFELNKNLKAKRDPWQPSFFDRRIRDSLEYARYKDYIWQNPVKRGLAQRPEDCAYSSANPAFRMDPVPQRLKPLSSAAFPQA
jgi:putative transposase